MEGDMSTDLYSSNFTTHVTTISKAPSTSLPPFVGETIPEPIRTIFIILAFLMMISGTFGNILVLVTLAKCPSLQSLHYIYVANLAIADLIIEAYSSPFVLYDLLLGYQTVGSHAHCVFNGFLVVTCYVTSLFTLAGISFNRYIRVCRFCLYQRYVTKGVTLTMVALVWVVSISVSAAPLLGWGRYSYDVKTHYCGYDRTASVSYTALISVGTIGVPAAAVCYFNFSIFRFVKKANQKLMSWKTSDTVTEAPTSEQDKTSNGQRIDRSLRKPSDSSSKGKLDMKSQDIQRNHRFLKSKHGNRLKFGHRERRRLLAVARNESRSRMSSGESSQEMSSETSGHLSREFDRERSSGSVEMDRDQLPSYEPLDKCKTHQLEKIDSERKQRCGQPIYSTEFPKNNAKEMQDVDDKEEQNITENQSVPYLKQEMYISIDINISQTTESHTDDIDPTHETPEKEPAGSSNIPMDRDSNDNCPICYKEQAVVNNEPPENSKSPDNVISQLKPPQPQNIHLLSPSDAKIILVRSVERNNTGSKVNPPSSEVNQKDRANIPKETNCTTQFTSLGSKTNKSELEINYYDSGIHSHLELPQLEPEQASTSSMPGNTTLKTSTSSLVTDKQGSEVSNAGTTSKTTRSSGLPRPDVSKKELAMIKTLFLVFVCLGIFMSPYMVSILADPHNTWPAAVHLICSELAVVNNAINWILYGALNKSFRRGYKKVLLSLCPCKMSTMSPSRSAK